MLSDAIVSIAIFLHAPLNNQAWDCETESNGNAVQLQGEIPLLKTIIWSFLPKESILKRIFT